jgi:hypothetical protein
MPDLIAYDSTRPHLIPADAWGILPYPDGRFAWTEADLARFPHAHRRFISEFGNARLASIAAVEIGALDPVEARGFIVERKRLFPEGTPTIYCDRARLPEVEAECAGLEFDRYIADWTGSPHWINGIERLVAVQFVGGVRAPYDKTLCKPGWLHPSGR